MFVFFFFFQAEDGIRDLIVTGVQTCALPIYRRARSPRPVAAVPRVPRRGAGGARAPRRLGPPADRELRRRLDRPELRPHCRVRTRDRRRGRDLSASLPARRTGRVARGGAARAVASGGSGAVRALPALADRRGGGGVLRHCGGGGGRGAPGRPLARGDRWCARRRALRPRDPRRADRGRAAQPNALPARGGGGRVAAGRGGGEDHAVAQAAAPSRDVGARARAHRGGGLEPYEAREPSRSDDAVGVPVLPGRGSAGRGPGDGRRHPGSRSAGRGGDRPRRLPAVYAARLTIARHAKYTGTPITTTASPSAL